MNMFQTFVLLIRLIKKDLKNILMYSTFENLVRCKKFFARIALKNNHHVIIINKKKFWALPPALKLIWIGRCASQAHNFC